MVTNLDLVMVELMALHLVMHLALTKVTHSVIHLATRKVLH